MLQSASSAGMFTVMTIEYSKRSDTQAEIKLFLSVNARDDETKELFLASLYSALVHVQLSLHLHTA